MTFACAEPLSCLPPLLSYLALGTLRIFSLACSQRLSIRGSGVTMWRVALLRLIP
jgi:hypothetical protein